MQAPRGHKEKNLEDKLTDTAFKNMDTPLLLVTTKQLDATSRGARLIRGR